MRSKQLSQPRVHVGLEHGERPLILSGRGRAPSVAYVEVSRRQGVVAAEWVVAHLRGFEGVSSLAPSGGSTPNIPKRPTTRCDVAGGAQVDVLPRRGSSIFSCEEGLREPELTRPEIGVRGPKIGPQCMPSSASEVKKPCRSRALGGEKGGGAQDFSSCSVDSWLVAMGKGSKRRSSGAKKGDGGGGKEGAAEEGAGGEGGGGGGHQVR